MVKQSLFCRAAVAAQALVVASAAAQYAGNPEMAQDVLKGRPYSPYADRAFPTDVYFGDVAAPFRKTYDPVVVRQRHDVIDPETRVMKPPGIVERVGRLPEGVGDAGGAVVQRSVRRTVKGAEILEAYPRERLQPLEGPLPPDGCLGVRSGFHSL